MDLDLVTPAYKGGATLARALPRPAAELTARVLSRTAATVSRERRMLVARHLRRATGGTLTGRALDRAVDATFDSYARYWVESFRLPRTPVSVVGDRFRVVDFHHVTDGLTEGRGVILALPHLGGWEWAGQWLTQVRGLTVTVVVESVEPPALFEFFAQYRRALGINIVPHGPGAGTEVLRALKANHVVCLLCDRDLGGDGVEVEFFGEVTTIPAGPATLALRTGAPLVPAAVYYDGDDHLGVVRPPLDTERRGRLRDDVGRVTAAVVTELEDFIRREPRQWHLQQPNWPSDYDALEAMGKPHVRPPVGPSSERAAAERASGSASVTTPADGPGA